MNSSLIKQHLARQMMQGLEPEQPAGFEQFSATELYCPKCRRAMPVRQRMLLVLSDGDLVDFVCQACGTSVGTRKG